MWHITTTMLQCTTYVGVSIVCVWDSAVFVVESTGCSITLGSAGAYRHTHTHTHKATWAHAVFVSEHWFINAPSEKLLWLCPEPQAPAKLQKCRGNKERVREWERVTVMNWSTVTVQFPVCSCLIQPDLWWLGEEFNHGNLPRNFEFQCFKNVQAISDCSGAAWHQHLSKKSL